MFQETTLYFLKVSEIVNKSDFIHHLNQLEEGYTEDKWVVEDLYKLFIVATCRYNPRTKETSIYTYRTNEKPEAVSKSYKAVIIHDPNDIQSLKNLIKLDELLEKTLN